MIDFVQSNIFLPHLSLPAGTRVQMLDQRSLVVEETLLEPSDEVLNEQ
jgi:hypothetical protein